MRNNTSPVPLNAAVPTLRQSSSSVISSSSLSGVPVRLAGNWDNMSILEQRIGRSLRWSGALWLLIRKANLRSLPSMTYLAPAMDDSGSSVLLVPESEDDLSGSSDGNSIPTVQRLSETGTRRKNRR